MSQFLYMQVTYVNVDLELLWHIMERGRIDAGFLQLIKSISEDNHAHMKWERRRRTEHVYI